MIAINLTPTDITEMRFAFSPLLETVVSFHMLTNPKSHTAQYMSWIDEALRALHDVDLPLMSALIKGCPYIPDFLTPTPTAPGVDFDEELKRMRAIPREIVVDNLQEAILINGDSELLRWSLAHQDEMMSQLIAELNLYWSRTLDHHWSRMTAILENDVLYRARQLAISGASNVINGLHPTLTYHDGTLTINKKWDHHKKKCYPDGYVFDIAGQGIHMIPVIFAFPKLYWQIEGGFQPMLMYAARGTGLWHYATLDDPEEALQITLGVGRARVLYALETPRSTGELAHLLDITAGAVSQHLSKLDQAGLVESSRSGKRVFYRLSQRGQKLIKLFA